VGPDFNRPAPPATDAYTPTALPAETLSPTGVGGGQQQFLPNNDIPGQWWTLFHSPPLEELIRQALRNSPSLAMAQATLRQSQETLRAQTGALYSPQLDLGGSATRQKSSGASFGDPEFPSTIFNLYNASVNVSYALDIFGGSRRTLEGLRAQVDYQNYQLQGAYLTLTSNIVTTAVQEGSLRAQIEATREILAAEEGQLGVTERQFTLGAIGRADVLTQRTETAQTRATLPPLEKALEQTRHQLAVLLGEFPSVAGLAQFRLEALQLPLELPLSLPSSLVRQRPDILAAEALLHQASADVGVATAQLYPQLTLSGSFGYQATTTGALFNTGTEAWSIGANLLQPLFHGGELTAQRRASIDAYDAASAQYRLTVLQAFQNVADTLRALEADARTLAAQEEAATLAGDSLGLTQRQFDLGAVSYLSLLTAQRQYQQTRLNLIQAQATRYADTAALFQALGGGWWNEAAPLGDRHPAP
jgi:NodT family efflux transporter outer membrane factor (OMF) lipoprotein